MPQTEHEPPGFPAEIPAPATLGQLNSVMRRCTRCDLYVSRTHVVPGAGSPAADLLFVGEAPGAREDEQGKPFVGASGRLLDTMLEAAGFLREEIYIANVVRCRPPANRAPKPREIRACAGWLAQQIRLLEPRLVVTLGRFALQHFLPGAKITEVQGQLQQVPYGDATVRVLPLLHPAAVLRNPELRTPYKEQFRHLNRTLASAVASAG
jgi:uracil-DNA glycosylase